MRNFGMSKGNRWLILSFLKKKKKICDIRMNYICPSFSFSYDFYHSNECKASKNENQFLLFNVNYLHNSTE